MLNILNNRAIADRYYLLSHLFNRYANRAKNIKNHARVNEDPKDALIRNLESEIARLRKQVEEGSFVCCSLKFSIIFLRYIFK